MNTSKASRVRGVFRTGVVTVSIAVGSIAAWAFFDHMKLVSQLHAPMAEHADQFVFSKLVKSGKTQEAFLEAFEEGDELFETEFNALDGVGANVGNGQRFTRVPRADLGEWRSHTPARATGPNAQACNHCHNLPEDDGAGNASANNIRDPLLTSSLRSFINRQPPHLFGIGAVQRLAEEMSEELRRTRNKAVTAAKGSGQAVKARLEANGVSFGSITAFPDGRVVTSDLAGVDSDLVIKPFDWKGVFPTVRSFNRDAAHNELGMQGVEITGVGVDGDFDRVSNELTVGDITALAVYNAAQPRPTTRVELATLKLIPALPDAEVSSIARGWSVFGRIDCDSCHVSQMRLDDPVFSEPSQSAAYREDRFPTGQSPEALGLFAALPVTFDLTSDQPDNQIRDRNGNVRYRLGSFEKDSQGRAIIRLFGDLKRHSMGADLAESIDAGGIRADVFLTEPLWGVGSTAPYLHDGRATTLTEAILAHGGEAADSRQRFVSSSLQDQKDLIAFLNNLVLFKLPEE